MDYYKHVDEADRWIPWSQPRVEPPVDSRTRQLGGRFGTSSFKLERTDYDSFWHDIPLRPPEEGEAIINLVTEIPMYMTPKMEVQKGKSGNVISQARHQ
jgi:hypothetical protein